MKPSVGRIVHFVTQPNSALGAASCHAAAIITDVVDLDREFVDLTVFPPRQDYLGRREVAHDEDVRKPGTWHWPEKVKE